MMTDKKPGPGAFVHVPKGTLHSCKNTGSTPGRMIVMLTPGGFEKLWEKLGEPATQLTVPPPVDPAVIQKLIALAPKYRLQIPPPPRGNVFELQLNYVGRSLPPGEIRAREKARDFVQDDDRRFEGDAALSANLVSRPGEAYD